MHGYTPLADHEEKVTCRHCQRWIRQGARTHDEKLRYVSDTRRRSDHLQVRFTLWCDDGVWRVDLELPDGERLDPEDGFDTPGGALDWVHGWCEDRNYILALQGLGLEAWPRPGEDS